MLTDVKSLSRLAVLFLVPLTLGACATTSTESGRSRFVAPRQLGEAYSQAELRTMLAFTADSQCIGEACASAANFRRQVQQLGAAMLKPAREISRELGRPVPNFIFLVPAKDQVGTLSSAAGTIVVFDGLRQLDLNEVALAYLIAREMGHVISEHHEEDSAISMATSVAVALAMPMAAVLRGAAFTFSALTSSSVLGTATSTAASMAGARAVKSIYRPDQLREADVIALKIMNHAGWSAMDVAAALQQASDKLVDEGWTGELLASKVRLESMSAGPGWSPPTTVADASAMTQGTASDLDPLLQLVPSAQLGPLPPSVH